MANRKGDRRERELVNRLDEAGFAVMRAPASGGATTRELPDVLAGNGGVFYAIEAKSSGGDPIYLTGEEVEGLVYFARNFGAKARIGVRFDREDWYFHHPDDLYQTDGGNYRVKQEKSSKGQTLDDLKEGKESYAEKLTETGETIEQAAASYVLENFEYPWWDEQEQEQEHEQEGEQEQEVES